MPENQNNTEQQKGVSWNPASLRSRTQDFVNFVKNAKEQQKMARINDSDRLAKEMMTSAMTTQNHGVANECNKSVKISQMANGARDHLSSMSEYQDIDLWDEKYTDYDIIDAYTAAFDGSEDIMKGYVQNEADTTCDPTETYKKLGWYQTEAEEETEWWLERVLLNLWSPVRIAGEGLRDLEYRTEGAAYDVADFVGIDKLTGRDLQREKEANKEVNRIREYALDKYSKWGLQVTDEEMNQATKDFLENEKLRDERMGYSDLTQGLTKGVGGGAWAVAEVGGFGGIPALINGIISTGMETPVAKEILTVGLSPLTALAEAMGWIMDETPSILGIWNSLDQESKDLIKYFSAGKLIGDALMKKNPTTGKVEFRKTIKDATNKLGDYVLEGISWLKGGRGDDGVPPAGGAYALEGQKSMNPRETNPDVMKKMDEKSNKILNSKTIPENRDITDALNHLERESLKKVKTYEDLFKTNEKYVKDIETKENALAESIDKTRGPEEDVWAGKDVSIDGKFNGEAKPNHPLNEFITKMEIMMADSSPEYRKAINAIRKKYESGAITSQDILNFKRMLSRQFDLYRYGKEGKELKVSKNEIETIRQGLNYLLRSEFDAIPEFSDIGLGNIFETLDSRWSPNLHMRGRLVDMLNDINKLKGQIPEDAWKATVSEKANQLTSLGGRFRMFADFFGGKGGKKKMTNALDFEENLRKSMKKFVNLMKEVPDEQKGQIESALIEYLSRKGRGPKESYGGNLGEGEVIDPNGFFDDYVDWENEAGRNSYLEDYIEIVEPDAPGYNTLGENPGVGPDLSTPIRVTPEGYPGRIGQLIESYRNTLKENGFSEKQIETVLDVLEKNDFKIKQQPSLFEGEAADALINEAENMKGQPKPTLDLQPIEELIKEVEEVSSKPKTTKSTKKVTKEDIDHLFGKDKTPAQRARETLEKAKKSGKKSEKKDK